MEFKSQICTTREQSERLLKLGLKKESADCYLFEYDKEKYKVIAESWLDLIEDKKYHSQYKDVCFPAWSLHRLLEMLYADIGECMIFFPNTYDEFIADIENCIRRGNFNKYCLEEK